MVAAAPGANSRGRGGKFRKFTRGGGKHFSRDLQPLDTEGNAVSMWSEDVQKQSSDDDDEDEESSEDELSRGATGQGGPSSSLAAAAGEEASRGDRKALKKARKEAAIAKAGARKIEVGDLPSNDESDDDDVDDDANSNMPVNPNHSAAARKQTSTPKQPDAGVEEITKGVARLPGNRREREAAEAAAAKERYMKLSAEGKTDTAKADLARLKLIREQREMEAARRQAEKEEKETQESKRRAEIEAREAKRREAAAGPKTSGKKKK